MVSTVSNLNVERDSKMLNVDSDSKSTGFLGEILHSLETYTWMPYLDLWQSYNFLLIQEMETDC